MLVFSFHGLILRIRQESKPISPQQQFTHTSLQFFIKRKNLLRVQPYHVLNYQADGEFCLKILLDRKIANKVKGRKRRQCSGNKRIRGWILMQDYTNTDVSLLACHYESSGRHQTHTKKNYASLFNSRHKLRTLQVVSCQLNRCIKGTL